MHPALQPVDHCSPALVQIPPERQYCCREAGCESSPRKATSILSQLTEPSSAVLRAIRWRCTRRCTIRLAGRMWTYGWQELRPGPPHQYVHPAGRGWCAIHYRQAATWQDLVFGRRTAASWPPMPRRYPCERSVGLPMATVLLFWIAYCQKVFL